MEERKTPVSCSESGTKSSKLPEWSKYLISVGFGGVLVIIAQARVAPIVAEQVMIQESITQKRYEACESAVNILQRILASATITGKPVPEGYTPTEKRPTQLEINVAYNQLLIYCKSQTIADEFFAATGPRNIIPADIVKFVSAVRKELGVKGSTIDKFQYRLLSPAGESGQEYKNPKDEQKE